MGRIQLCLNQRDFQLLDWSTGTKILDANGDGLKDLLIWSLGSSANGTEQASPAQLLTLYLNTGRNQFRPVAIGTPAFMLSADIGILNSVLNAGSVKQSFVYDVDQDGRQDLVFFDASTKSAYALLFQPGMNDVMAKRRGEANVAAPRRPDGASLSLGWQGPGRGGRS